MRNYLICFFSLVAISTAPARDMDLNKLRKMTLQSDVIFAGRTSVTAVHYNDYLTQLSFTVKHLDRMILNRAGFEMTDSVRVIQPFRDYSWFWDENRILPFDPESYKEIDQSYTDISFIRMDSGQSRFVLIGSLGTILWKDFLNYYQPAIEDLQNVVNITDPSERYHRSIDWYIRWNGYPDKDFFEYYHQKGVVQDPTVLEGEQLLRARDKFLEGNEELFPFVIDRFKKEVFEYYIRKMKRIRNIQEPERSNYREFKHAVDNLLGNRNADIDYYLRWQLLEDRNSKYDRWRIMDYYIGKAEAILKESGD